MSTAARLLSQPASSRRTDLSSGSGTATGFASTTAASFTQHPDYDDLPDVLKSALSPKEFAWLTDSQRADIVSDLCNPDVEG